VHPGIPDGIHVGPSIVSHGNSHARLTRHSAAGFDDHRRCRCHRGRGGEISRRVRFKNSALSVGFSHGYNFPTQFSFQSVPANPTRARVGSWVANGKERERDTVTRECAEGCRKRGRKGGEVRRSPYSCIVARSIAFSTELNSTQQWRTQWAV